MKQINHQNSNMLTQTLKLLKKWNKNVIIEVEEQENAVSSFKANQLDIQNSFDNIITVEPVKEVLDSVNDQESYLNSINTNDHTEFLPENTLNHNLHERTSPIKAGINEENIIDLTNDYETCAKVKGKEVLNKENGLDEKSSILTYLLSTPNKLDSTDNQKNSTELSTSPVSCTRKVVPSTLLSSTLNISEHLLRTPSAAERSCKTPLKSTARTNSRKKKGTSVLPDHYTPVVSRIDMHKNPGSSCKSKKKLFSIETDNLLQDTPPEVNQTIQVSKLVPPETTKLVLSETTVNNTEKEGKNSSESESTKDVSDELILKMTYSFLTNESKSRTLTVTANKSEKQLHRKSLFSDFEFSDASDSDPWLHKKSTKKLSIKTYRGKPKKKRIYLGTSESDEFVVGREKRKAKSFPLRERKRHSSSDEDDLILFKSPKVAKMSSRPGRTIVTRSMTNKTTTNKKKTSTNKNTKRKYFVDTLDSTISSPEVMRDTSLSQTASSFSEAQQISDINLTKPKNKKYKKFKKDISTCVNEINSSNESPIRSQEIDQFELVKEVLMDTLRPNLNTQNLISVQSLPPNPPNNTPVSEYLEDKNRSEIFNGIGSLSERKFGPQSTSSPKINYIGESGSYINSSDGLDKDKHCGKSPPGLKVSKLNFENNENKSAEDIVYESPYRRDFMIPVHPNSDFSSSDELEPASLSELAKPEDLLKSNHNKKVVYIRKKTSTDGKPEDINKEIFLSPLAPQSLEELLKCSQNSDVIGSVPFTSSNGFKITTESGAVCTTNSLCSKSQRNLINKGDKENTERANLVDNAHDVEIMTGHSVYSETPRASVNQNMHQTPSKLCPKSLFEHEQCKRDSTRKQSESQPNLQEKLGPSGMCSTSTQSRRDNEPKAQENSRLMSDTVRVPLSTLNLLLEEVRTMGDLFKHNSRKCSVIYEVFKNMINRPMDAD
ncbi:hypothetical protein Avbf_14336 [Armadillidium vulgare]|nr:hypothetical protein Avbf_14336 [Armadillidium vulgare]